MSAGKNNLQPHQYQSRCQLPGFTNPTKAVTKAVVHLKAIAIRLTSALVVAKQLLLQTSNFIAGMTNNFIIRKIRAADVEQLAAISRQTFFETFADKNTEANMTQYLLESFNTDALRTEIDNQNSQFYFAKLNGKAIGYLKVNTGAAQTERTEEAALEIERIYVLQAHQGQKLGQLLFDKAIAIATDRKVRYVWLGVWEENEKALSFYKKNGFTEFGRHDFWLGNDKQTDILMKRELAPPQ